MATNDEESWEWHRDKFDEAYKDFNAEMKKKGARRNCWAVLGKYTSMVRQAALVEDKTLMGRSRKAKAARAKMREAIGRARTRFGGCMR